MPGGGRGRGFPGGLRGAGRGLRGRVRGGSMRGAISLRGDKQSLHDTTAFISRFPVCLTDAVQKATHPIYTFILALYSSKSEEECMHVFSE